jgi:hypothetical protein
VKSTQNSATPVRSSRETRPRGWLLRTHTHAEIEAKIQIIKKASKTSPMLEFLCCQKKAMW